MSREDFLKEFKRKCTFISHYDHAVFGNGKQISMMQHIAKNAIDETLVVRKKDILVHESQPYSTGIHSLIDFSRSTNLPVYEGLRYDGTEFTTTFFLPSLTREGTKITDVKKFLKPDDQEQFVVYLGIPIFFSEIDVSELKFNGLNKSMFSRFSNKR